MLHAWVEEGRPEQELFVHGVFERQESEKNEKTNDKLEERK
jgi:hypothetical protein